jgi:hypothetical protein
MRCSGRSERRELRRRRRHSCALAAFFALASSCTRTQPPLPGFRDLVQELSEEGGYFDTDNLISNETAYVQVIPDLEPAGGVYIGVGPEQNFHYIGRLRPKWAFILDVRRDNLLHHLLLNALLARSDTPRAYLCRLFSRRCPEEAGKLDFEQMVAVLEDSQPDRDVFARNLDEVFEHVDGRLAFPLDAKDRRVLELTYRSFFDEQLELRFQSHGRPPMPYHPTYRTLLLARDREGKPAHFLARPEDYRHVRRLALEGRLVPVVGDFAGRHALKAIGGFAREQGETVAAFYVSNVEFYLLRGGLFSSYVENVRALPLSEASQFIRAYFSYGYPHPAALAGHRSTLVRQRIYRFLELFDRGAYEDYWDVSTLDYER